MTAEKKAAKGRVVPEATSSGIPIEPFYGEPAPGEFPFTRGISAEGYRRRFWTMRQYAGFGSARESNRRYRYLLEQGQTGLSVAFDLPTQMGYDSDDPLARGEVGKAGVSIATIDDMRAIVQRFVTAYGKGATFTASFLPDQKDFADLVAKMKAAGVDTIYLAASGSDAGRLTAQAQAAELADIGNQRCFHRISPCRACRFLCNYASGLNALRIIN